MRNISLRYKLFFAMTAVILLYTVISFILINQYLRQTLKEQMIDNGRALTSSIAIHVADSILMKDYVAVDQFFDNIKRTNPSVSYIFVEKDGELLIHTFNEGFPKNLLDVGHEKKGGDYVDYKVLRTEKEDYFDFHRPVMNGREGYLRLGISTKGIEDSLQKAFKTRIAIAIAAFIATIIFSLLISKKLVSPLASLTYSAAYVAESDYSKTVPVESFDEVGKLTAAFNKMVEAVRVREAELRNTNEELESVNITLHEYIVELNRTKDELVKSKQNAAVVETSSAFLHHIRQPLTYLIIAIDLFIEEIQSAGHFDEDTLLIKLKAIEDAGMRLGELLKRFEKLDEYKIVEYTDKTRILDIGKLNSTESLPFEEDE